MAPNSSSLFNETPADPKPAPVEAPPSSPTIGPPPTSSPSTPSSSVGILTSSASSSTSSSPSTSSTSMSPSSSDLSESKKRETKCATCYGKTDASKPRFSRVMLENYKGSPSLTSEIERMHSTTPIRKPCLRRSKSVVPREPVCSSEPCPEPEVAIALKDSASPQAISLDDSVSALPMVPLQKNRRRCWHCRVKVSLTAVTCKCGYTFCSKHRYAEEHECGYNFRTAAKRKLKDENPRVVATKVAKID